MSLIVREMPFSDRARALDILGVRVKVFAYEPVVWVSVTPPHVTALPPDAPKFLAVVDSGNTSGFNIREGHLAAWTIPQLTAANLPPAAPPSPVHDASGSVTVLPRYRANVWLHPYPDGGGLPPLILQPIAGILVYTGAQAMPEGGGIPQPSGPHLPLLGARSFRPAGLTVSIDYRRLRVTISTEDPHPAETAGLLPGLWRRWRRWFRSETGRHWP